MKNSWNKYFAEFIGTFALVFAGTGAIIVNDVSGGIVTHVGIALTFGLIVTAMIYSIGSVSGAHINPAVTIGFCLGQRLCMKTASMYIIFQIMGAVFASYLLKLLFPLHGTLGSTLPSGSIGQSFVLEIILAFLLMFVILNISRGAKEQGIMAGVAIGGTIAFEALFAGPISGASMNPARSIAPAIVSGNIQHLWIYICAPIIGAILAVPFCYLIHGPECCQVKTSESSESNIK